MLYSLTSTCNPKFQLQASLQSLSIYHRDICQLFPSTMHEEKLMKLTSACLRLLHSSSIILIKFQTLISKKLERMAENSESWFAFGSVSYKLMTQPISAFTTRHLQDRISFTWDHFHLKPSVLLAAPLVLTKSRCVPDLWRRAKESRGRILMNWNFKLIRDKWIFSKRNSWMPGIL